MSRIADPRTKIELLRAAESVFTEHGLTASKVEHITARAGVSKGAFYLHFESKDDCWRQIIEGFVAKLANCVDDPDDAFGERRHEDATEHLARWHQHDLEILEFCWSNRAILKMVLAGGGGVPYAYLIDELAVRMAETSEAWLRLAMSAGVYREDLEPRVVAALISGAYERLVRELISLPKRPDIAAWSHQALSLFTRGLLTDEARRVLDREVSTDAARSARRGARGGQRRRPIA